MLNVTNSCVVVSWRKDKHLESSFFDSFSDAVDFVYSLKSEFHVSDIRILDLSLYTFSEEVEKI